MKTLIIIVSLTVFSFSSQQKTLKVYYTGTYEISSTKGFYQVTFFDGSLKRVYGTQVKETDSTIIVISPWIKKFHKTYICGYKIKKMKTAPVITRKDDSNSYLNEKEREFLNSIKQQQVKKGNKK